MCFISVLEINTDFGCSCDHVGAITAALSKLISETVLLLPNLLILNQDQKVFTN